jgi:cleavage and polyadenylation specificity factor subunit 6/7
MASENNNVTEDILEGEDMLNLEDLDEKEVLGDDDEKDDEKVTFKKELEGDDLYDAAIEPSSTVNEKRESTDDQSQNSTSRKPSVTVKSEPSATQQPTGKRYCCYIGNMTWWTTDAELEKIVQTFGIDDLIDIKFYENRNNGQSKGFALAVFGSETSVKTLMEKLPNKQMHEQSLVVLPYTKQSLAKLEEATKRYDQKSGDQRNRDNPPKEEKVVNIGTIRIGTNGAPVPQLMSSINLAQLARPVIAQPPHSQPTSLLSLNFSAPPVPAAGPQVNALPPVGFPHNVRPQQAVSVGLVTNVSASSVMQPGTPNLNNAPSVLVQQQQHPQQQQMAAMAAAAHQQQQQAAAAAMLMQQQQQQAAAVAAANQQRQNLAAATASAPPPTIGGMVHHQQPPPTNTSQQQVLQQAMSRPPPSFSTLGLNTAAPPPVAITSVGGMAPSHQMMQQQNRVQFRQPDVNQMSAPGIGIQGMQPQPGFPPGAHINPQVYPNFAHGAAGAYGHPENGAMMSELEFQEIMTRNQTVSSSAIHRAVSDAAGGDYASAIETLVTAISLIRQSRVAHDDRCKLLINTLQDTLNGIEAKSYSSGIAGGSRKHRRERSRSPIRTSKRHRRSPSPRSRSRERGGGLYEYSPVRHSISRRY